MVPVLGRATTTTTTTTTPIGRKRPRERPERARRNSPRRSQGNPSELRFVRSFIFLFSFFPSVNMYVCLVCNNKPIGSWHAERVEGACLSPLLARLPALRRPLSTTYCFSCECAKQVHRLAIPTLYAAGLARQPTPHSFIKAAKNQQGTPSEQRQYSQETAEVAATSVVHRQRWRWRWRWR